MYFKCFQKFLHYNPTTLWTSINSPISQMRSLRLDQISQLTSKQRNRDSDLGSQALKPCHKIIDDLVPNKQHRQKESTGLKEKKNYHHKLE